MLYQNTFHNSDDAANGWITLVEYGAPEESFEQLRNCPELPTARHPADWPETSVHTWDERGAPDSLWEKPR